jgi:hypothetical protein
MATVPVFTALLHNGNLDRFFTFPTKTTPHAPTMGNFEPWLVYALYSSAAYMRDKGIISSEGYDHLLHAPFEELLRDLGSLFYRVIVLRNSSSLEANLWQTTTSNADQASWVFNDKFFDVNRFIDASNQHSEIEELLCMVYTIIRCNRHTTSLVGESGVKLIARADWFTVVRLLMATSTENDEAMAEFGGEYWRLLQDESSRFSARVMQFTERAESYRVANRELEDAIVKNGSRKINITELLEITKPIDIIAENTENKAEKRVIDANLVAIQVEGFRQIVRDGFNIGSLQLRGNQ